MKTEALRHVSVRMTAFCSVSHVAATHAFVHVAICYAAT